MSSGDSAERMGLSRCLLKYWTGGGRDWGNVERGDGEVRDDFKHARSLFSAGFSLEGRWTARRGYRMITWHHVETQTITTNLCGGEFFKCNLEHVSFIMFVFSHQNSYCGCAWGFVVRWIVSGHPGKPKMHSPLGYLCGIILPLPICPWPNVPALLMCFSGMMPVHP